MKLSNRLEETSRIVCRWVDDPPKGCSRESYMGVLSSDLEHFSSLARGLEAEVERLRAALEVFLAPAIVFAIPDDSVRDSLQSQVREDLLFYTKEIKE